MIKVGFSCRFLSHSELAPLRVPLVPMEHCTSRFFQECDADKDKQVSLKEWTSCFGIKNGESGSTTCSFSSVQSNFSNISHLFLLNLNGNYYKMTNNAFLISTEDMDINQLF